MYDHLVQFGPSKIGDIIYCLDESQQQHHVADAFREVSVPTVLDSATSTQNAVTVTGMTPVLDRTELLRIRRLVLADDEAIDKWPIIVEHIVQSGADRARIIHLINRDQNYKAAVLKTLRLWEGYGSERPDLLKALRDEGLHRLADQIGG